MTLWVRGALGDVELDVACAPAVGGAHECGCGTAGTDHAKGVMRSEGEKTLLVSGVRGEEVLWWLLIRRSPNRGGQTRG